MAEHKNGKQGRLMIIGGTPWLYDRAKQLNLEVFLIQKPELYDRNHAALVDRVLLLDYGKDPLLLPLLRAVHQETPFDTCLTLTESALLTAAQINEALGLPGVKPDVVELTRNKYKMRQHLAELGFPSARFAMGCRVDDVIDFGREHGFPLIVKPHDGVGSRGILLIKDVEELNNLQSEHLPGEEFLIEEYLEGPEFSVEAFTFHGKHSVFAVTEKTTLPENHIEKAHRVPAVLTEENEVTIRAHVVEFLTVIGLEEGPSHTEIKLTPNGPRVIETHTRLGGDNIPDLVQMSTGYDLRTLSLGWLTGKVEAVYDPQPVVGGAAVRYFTPPEGVLKRIVGVEAARCQRGVVRVELDVKTGDHVPVLKHSRDRVGYVLSIADTSEEASQLCEQIDRQITFLY